MVAPNPQSDATPELTAALAGEDALLAWFDSRGYVPAAAELPAPPAKSLAGSRHLHSPAHPKAPRVLLRWDPSYGERGIHGKRLRQLQADANEFRDHLRGLRYVAEAPSLFALGCPEFLLFFPLNGDPYARRLRFTPDRVSHQEWELSRHYRELNAETMAGWAMEPPAAEASGVLARLRKASAELRYTFDKLLVGGQFDEDFVAFMSQERRRIVRILLDRAKRRALLRPVLDALGIHAEGFKDGEREPDGYPTLTALVKLGDTRKQLVATVDTVLLRLVLYRYLEAQFGYRVGEDEQSAIAFGSYDDVLEQTTRVDPQKAEVLRDRARKAHAVATGGKAGAAARPQQLLLFGPPPEPAVQVVEPAAFASEVRERGEYYQSSAGGDLHRGRIAAAADVLQEHLLEQHRDELAGLLEGTRASSYSFHYADLDPRAFQRFYEESIGTDIRVLPGAGDGALPTVEVVPWHRNRKEQGAYFTNEKLCRWLVERTLGRRFTEWRERLRGFLDERAREPAGRLPALRQLLDELLGWRILDPTCGGGIFLRTAFEHLAHRRQDVVDLLRAHLPDEVWRELTRDAPYDLFGPKSEAGRWEWYILLHLLYGVDVDVKAINIASNLLTLSALTYKRHGICFPSFINTNLKRGNALVVPLPPERRKGFAATWGAAIRQLIALRQELRDPNLPRAEWLRLHDRAAALTKEVVDAQVEQTFRPLFPDLDGEALRERVSRVGVFLYEIEFPEAFFEPDGTWRDNPGFDVVLGNPPWEEPAAEYKHFLPEFDPEYRDLSGKASKDREDELLADPAIARRWETFRQSVADYKTLLTSGWYRHQRVAVKGKIPGAHTNLYKYATELAYRVLREGGDAGLVLDGGLWSDLAAKGLRQLLVDGAEVPAVCGFTNNEGLFPDVHRSYKFSGTVFRRGKPADALAAVFMRRSFDDVDAFDDVAVRIPTEEIRSDPRDSYPVPEVRSAEHGRATRALEAHPALGEPPWSVDTYSRELNAGEQREYFHATARPGFYPLVQGSQFNLFGVHQGEPPGQWVDPSDAGAGGFLRRKQEGRILLAIADWLAEQGHALPGGKQDAALEWIAALTGTRAVPGEWVRLDWDGPRLAWRTTARNDDRRTLIAAVVPARVAMTDKAPFIKPFALRVGPAGISWPLQYSHEQLLYLAGMLSSFPCDSIARTRIAKTDLKKNAFEGFHVPVWQDTPRHRRVAELTARLTCLPATPERPWADYTDLAAALGLTPERDGLVDPVERREAEVELNARAAELYGLGRKELRFLLDTLFMTPKHRDTHEQLRDAIAERMGER